MKNTYLVRSYLRFVTAGLLVLLPSVAWYIIVLYFVAIGVLDLAEAKRFNLLNPR